MELCYIPTSQLTDFWPRVRRYISKGLEFSGGRHSEKTVIDKLISGAMQLWILATDGEIPMSVITQLMTYPTNLKVCEVFVLGGHDMKEWTEFTVKQLSEWAKSMECQKMEVVGRPGWEKVLKGWGKVAVMLELPLGENHG